MPKVVSTAVARAVRVLAEEGYPPVEIEQITGASPSMVHNLMRRRALTGRAGRNAHGRPSHTQLVLRPLRALHHPYDDATATRRCASCRVPWPCPTAVLLREIVGRERRVAS
jgi:hypothetical protein